MVRQRSSRGNAPARQNQRWWVLRESRLRSVLLLSLLAGTIDGMIIPFLALVAQDRGVPLSAIGGMAAAFLLAQLALQVPFGALSDRVGRAWIVSIGVTLMGIAALGFAIAESPSTWILLRVIQGFGVAALLPSLRALVADITPLERRGEAFAAFNAAFHGGIFGGPLLGGWLASAVGDRGLFIIAAVTATALAIVVPFGFPEFRRPMNPAESAAVDLQPGPLPVTALLTPALIGAYLLSAAGQVTSGLTTAVWGIYVSDLGGSDLIVGLTYSAFAIMLFVLAPVSGRLASKRPRWRTLLIAEVLLGLTVAAYGQTDSIQMLLVLSVAEGACSAIAMPTLDAYLTTVANRQMMGRVQGTFAMAGTLGAASVGWVSAVLYAEDPSLPFLMSGLLIIILSIPATFFVRRTERHLRAKLSRRDQAASWQDSAPV